MFLTFSKSVGFTLLFFLRASVYSLLVSKSNSFTLFQE